jgi:hypothetical protein
MSNKWNLGGPKEPWEEMVEHSPFVVGHDLDEEYRARMRSFIWIETNDFEGTITLPISEAIASENSD